MAHSRPRAARAALATLALSAVFTLAIGPAASAQPLPPLSEYEDQDVILYEINFGEQPDGLYSTGSSIAQWVVNQPLGPNDYSTLPTPLAIDQGTYGPGVNMGYPQLQSVIETGQSLYDDFGGERFITRIQLTFTNVPFDRTYGAEIGGRANVAPPGVAQEDMETRIRIWDPEFNTELTDALVTSDPVNTTLSGGFGIDITEGYSASTPGVMRLIIEAEGVGAAGVPGILQYFRLTSTDNPNAYPPLGSDPLPVSIVSPTVAVPAAIGLASLLALGLAFVGVRHLRRTRIKSI